MHPKARQPVKLHPVSYNHMKRILYFFPSSLCWKTAEWNFQASRGVFGLSLSLRGTQHGKKGGAREGGERLIELSIGGGKHTVNFLSVTYSFYCKLNFTKILWHGQIYTQFWSCDIQQITAILHKLNLISL